MVDSGIQTLNLRIRSRGDTRQCIMQDTNDSADTKSARHGQFQEIEKNTDYWIEYFPFEIFFSTEKIYKLKNQTRK